MRQCTQIPNPFKTAGLVMLLTVAASVGYAEDAGGIPWLTSLDAAKEQAAAQNKLIFMDVFAEWCGPCKMLASETFTAPEVIKALEAYVPLKIDSDKQPQIASQYGVRGVPTLFVLTAQGAAVHEQSGFMPPAGFLEFLQTAQSRMEAIARLEEEVRQQPDNVGKALELAKTYMELSRAGDAVTLLEKAGPKVDAVDSDATKGDYAFTLGLACLIEGAYDKGVERLESLLEAYPGYSEAERAKDLILRGKVYGALTRVDKGEYEAARTMLTGLRASSTDEQVTAFVDEVLGRLEVLGQPAPAWAVTWVGSKSASLQEVKGNVVALAFLDPSDSGSAEVAATLETLRQEHGTRGLASVAIVSAPEASEEAAAADVEAWAGEHGVTYPVGVDKQGRATFDLYKGEQIPWVALIGRDGVVHYLGAYSKTEFDGKLATLLAAER